MADLLPLKQTPAQMPGAGIFDERDEVVGSHTAPGPPSGPVEGEEARLWPVAGRRGSEISRCYSERPRRAKESLL